MCGRYALFTLGPELLEELLGFVPIDEHGLLTPRWNIAPTQRAPVFRVGGEGLRELTALRWGLVPPWADDLKMGARCINARSEEAATKASFRAAWKARRCLVPADGFYEWPRTAKPKRAVYFRAADGAPLLFAGLWESWTDKTTGEVVETYAILTRAPYSAVAPVHDRSPLVVPRDRRDEWLDPHLRDPARVVAGAAEPELVAVAVGDAVNDARNEGPGLVEPRRE